MSHLDFILHALNGIQRKWVYLEPIFGRGSLPNEAKRFKSVDEDFRDIMRNVEADPKLFGLVDPHVHRDIRRTLETMLDQLDRCQKALSDFLEEKRSAFPRFYFIGDDDLLEILGQAKNPAVIQSHLKKLFQGVSRVVFDDAKTTITAMVSASGEVVARVGIKPSSRLQCARMRLFRRGTCRRASRTRGEPSIRPKISRIDFDATEMERSEVWRGPPEPAVGIHAGRRPRDRRRDVGPRRGVARDVHGRDEGDAREPPRELPRRARARGCVQIKSSTRLQCARMRML